MSYFPNIHAVKWFVVDCFSSIVKKHPDAFLVIAGKNPPSEIKKMEIPGQVNATGYVESMYDSLNQASIAIASMQSGSGIQAKILGESW